MLPELLRTVQIPGQVVAPLPQLATEGAFDIIYLDPPYASGLEEQVIAGIDEHGLLADGGRIIVEAALDRTLSIEDGAFSIVREKIYKTNKHIFLERR